MSLSSSTVEPAEQVLQWAEDLRAQNLWIQPVQFFNFDANSSYKDCAEAALFSLLAEVYSHSLCFDKKVSIQETLQTLDICRNPQIQDLYYMWIGLYFKS